MSPARFTKQSTISTILHESQLPQVWMMLPSRLRGCMAASRALHSHTSPQWHHVRSACFRHQLRSIKLANRIVCIGQSCPRVQAIGFSRCRHPRPFCTNGNDLVEEPCCRSPYILRRLHSPMDRINNKIKFVRNPLDIVKAISRS